MNKNILTGVILCVLPSATLADNPSFDYIELGYTNWNVDGLENVGGIDVRTNYRISDSFYAAGDHAAFLEKAFDTDITSLGFGYILDFSSNSSFFAEASYALFHVDGGFDHEGYKLTSGVRSMFTDNLELKAAIERFDLFDDNTDGDSLKLTSLVLGAAYKIPDSMTVYFEYKIDHNVNRLGIGARFHF